MSGPSRISPPGERVMTGGAGPSSSGPSSSGSVGANAACAACKYQRRKCANDCPLAPYFPPDQPKRFLNVHRLFGVSSILRILRHVDLDRREDTVKSIVYEADAREKDPVHGCLGIINMLQNQVNKLKDELAIVQDRLHLLQQQHASFLHQSFEHQHPGSQANFHYNLQSQYNPSTSHQAGVHGSFQGNFHDVVPGQIMSYQDSRASSQIVYHDHGRYLVGDQDSALPDILGHPVKVESSDPYNRSSNMGNMRYVSDSGGSLHHVPEQQQNLGLEHHHHGGSSSYVLGGDLERRTLFNPLVHTHVDGYANPLRSGAVLPFLDPLPNHSSHVTDPELRNAGVHLSLKNQYSK